MTKRRSEYESLLKEVTETLQKSGHSLHQALEMSEKAIQAASDMTKDEFSLIVASLKADLQAFADQYETDKSGPFYLTIANSIWEGLASITDHTVIEWHQLSKELDNQGQYHVGDIIGFGTLICEYCERRTIYNHPMEVTACPSCGGELFYRAALKHDDGSQDREDDLTL